MTKELIIGGSGYVASEYVRKNNEKLWIPSSSEVDITNKNSIKNFLLSNPGVKTLINFAAYTNTKQAQIENGFKDGLSWKINVEGTKNLAEVCQEFNIFFVYISTDNVFFDVKGPSKEKSIPANDGKIDWYGHTKLKGEEAIAKSRSLAAITRISYPFGIPSNPKDLCMKLINSMSRGYPLFDDQFFTPTYLPQAYEALELISGEKQQGVFHLACRGITTPYRVGLQLKNLLDLPFEVKKGSLLEYEKLKGRAPFAQYGGLTTTSTQIRLGQRFLHWTEALEKEREKYKSQLPNILG